MSIQIELLEPLAITSAKVSDGPKVQSFLQQVRQDLEDLSVTISLASVDPETLRPTLLLEGTDAQAARSYIAANYGVTLPLGEVKAEMRVRGILREPGKVGFGIFLDAGFVSPAKDVLVSLRTLRTQLAKDQSLPLRPMIRALGLVEGYPLELEIMYANEKIGKVEARLSAGQVTALQDWMRANYERVLFSGATRQHVKNALKKAGHEVDVVALERQGLQAGYVVLKAGTQAPGILRAIGAALPEARLGAYRPGRWKELLQAGSAR